MRVIILEPLDCFYWMASGDNVHPHREISCCLHKTVPWMRSDLCLGHRSTTHAADMTHGISGTIKLCLDRARPSPVCPPYRGWNIDAHLLYKRYIYMYTCLMHSRSTMNRDSRLASSSFLPLSHAERRPISKPPLTTARRSLSVPYPKTGRQPACSKQFATRNRPSCIPIF